MSSNYNYNLALAHLNSLTPVAPPPEMSEEDLARELEFWSNAQFTFEVPPGMGLLDEEFSTMDTKPEDQDVNNVATPMIIQQDITPLTDQTQTQQALQYPLFTFPPANTLVRTRLQPVPISPVSSNAEDFTSMFPTTPIAPATIPTTNVNNSMIETQETTTPSNTKSTSDSTVTKTTTATATNSNSGPILTNRKNSSTKSNNSETTQNESTNEGEKDPELAAKLAAEEDKRRRNTAASARFRVKKKMREQALERTAREMTAKAETFENRVKELEMEIKWLRSLIVEKDSRLLDVERPDKKRKKESQDDEEKENDDKEEKVVKHEHIDQANQKGAK